MSAPEPGARWLDVEPWLEVAAADRRTAAVCLVADPPLAGVAAFHCQQAAEKLMKGMLVWSGTDFRRTHSLRELGDAVAGAMPAVAALVRQTEDWTVWAVAYRYPSAEELPEPEPSVADLKQCLSVIDALTAALRSLASAGWK